MMVHRLLAKYAEGARSTDKGKLEDQCRHSSDMEQLAANAERASIRYKQVEFMKDTGRNLRGRDFGRDRMGILCGAQRQ